MGVSTLNFRGRQGTLRHSVFRLAVLAALPLAACSGDTSLLGGDLSDSAAITQPAAPVTKPIRSHVGFRQPVGPPDSVSLELTRQLNAAAIDQGIALIADPNLKPDLMLRGYVSALRKGSAVNVSYIWDVLDQRGQRVTRFEGEEALTASADAKEPWAAMTPAVSRSIAQRTMADLSRWLTSNPALASATLRSPAAPGGFGASGSAQGAPAAASLAPSTVPPQQ